MPVPASLIASIVSAVIEAASSGAAVNPAQYETYVINRTLPPQAKLGVMLPPAGDGFIVINERVLPLSPAAQFRSQQNFIVMPMSIQDTKNVVYVSDASGAVFRVWMVNPAEILARPAN